MTELNMTETITYSPPLAIQATATPDSLAIVLDDGRRLEVPWCMLGWKLTHARQFVRRGLQLVSGGSVVSWATLRHSLRVDALLRDFPKFVVPSVVTIDTNGGI